MTQLESTIREAITERELFEASDTMRKIDDLVRLGLMPVHDLPLLRRALIHMQTDMFLPSPEREIFYRFVRSLISVTTADPTINSLLRQRVSMKQYAVKSITVKEGTGVQLKGTPEGTLVAYANAVKNKVRAGGKPTSNDRKLASAAKSELRRRRNVASKRMSESTIPYAKRVELALEEFGISSISELDVSRSAEFFEYVDNITTHQGE